MPLVVLLLFLVSLVNPTWGMESANSRSAENARAAAHTRSAAGLVARDEHTGQQGWKPVTRLWRGETERVCYLTVIPQRRGRGERRRHRSNNGGQKGGEEGSEPPIGPLRVEDAQQTIRCTPGHDFYRWSTGEWIDAGALRPGDILRASDGLPVRVLRSTTRLEAAQTFNLQVADWHTYFVCDLQGITSVWVHNANCDESWRAYKQGREAAGLPYLSRARYRQLWKAGAGNAKRVAERNRAARGHQASFGSSSSSNYRDTFFGANPSQRGTGLWVHHAVEQQAMARYPRAGITASEMHSLQNLRGIPASVNGPIHLSAIRVEWNRFYRQNPTATKAELLAEATRIDDMFGRLFAPPVR